MELLPTRDVVKRLGSSTSTISRLVQQGKLTPAIRGDGIRGSMWFRAEDIDEYAQTLASAEEAEANDKAAS